MNRRAFAALTCAVAVGALCPTLRAQAADFDWKRHQGQTITFLVNTNPLGNSIVKYKGDFEKLTGMTVKVDAYQEQQMRQRLVTAMNARSDEIDVFMTLPSREGLQFAKAGWYADLAPMTKDKVAPDYDFAGFSPALVQAATIEGKLTSIPLNIEGPLVYYRKDLLQKCGAEFPKRLEDMEPTLQKLKACNAETTPFVSRGLKPALPYTFSVFLHNMGGQYMKDGKSALCSPQGQAALGLYAKLLKDYGPPGVVNSSFYQISSLYREGRVAMAFESSNELSSMMEGGARLRDTGIAPLPPGSAGSVPTTIGWGLTISAHSKKQDPAWLFVQWVSSPAMQEKLALEGIAAPRASVAKSEAVRKWLDAEPSRREWQTSLDELAQKGTSEVGYPIVANPASREIIGQAVSELVLGTKPLDKACADADTALNALIAKEQ